ncbi:MAG: phage recombination protein Bet, partial [Zoogloeaceae bacterium]|nr:phage recombination protein Bet [Zoogloeaceae bacterium]
MSNPLINLTMKSSLPSVGMSEAELLSVLENSIYPGAKPESIKLAIGYCRASGLDPMQKPVHIVPMLVSTGKKDGKGYDIKEWRDVIMPGIGLYRTQAARSGQYAGVSEPEFGQDVTEEFDGVSLTYPAWCRVTVKKSLPNGIVAEFSVKEFWKENYATRGKSAEPNSMWRKRPYAQIAKCAEAQALRKAFPEIGAQPTADEMEGKNPDDDETIIDSDTGEILKPEAPEETKALLPYPEDRLEDSLQK